MGTLWIGRFRRPDRLWISFSVLDGRMDGSAIDTMSRCAETRPLFALASFQFFFRVHYMYFDCIPFISCRAFASVFFAMILGVGDDDDG